MSPALAIDTPRSLKEYAPNPLELLMAVRREGFLGWLTNTWRQQGDLFRLRMGTQSLVRSRRNRSMTAREASSIAWSRPSRGARGGGSRSAPAAGRSLG